MVRRLALSFIELLIVLDPPLVESLKVRLDKLQESVKKRELLDENGEIIFPNTDHSRKSVEQAIAELCFTGAEVLADDPDKRSNQLMKRVAISQTKLAEIRAQLVIFCFCIYYFEPAEQFSGK